MRAYECGYKCVVYVDVTVCSCVCALWHVCVCMCSRVRLCCQPPARKRKDSVATFQRTHATQPPNGSPVNTTLKVINLAPKDCGINLREH